MSAKEGRRAGPEVLFLILEELRSLNERARSLERTTVPFADPAV